MRCLDATRQKTSLDSSGQKSRSGARGTRTPGQRRTAAPGVSRQLDLARIANRARQSEAASAPKRCSACEEESKPQRIGSDSTDDSLDFPREVNSFTPAPAPPVSPPNPPPPAPAASCCDQALSAGLDQGDYGGIICCNNVKHVCVWQANINRNVTNPTAQGIVGECVRVHEATHVNQVDCTGAALERPPFRPGVDPNKAECNAYRAEAACYASKIGGCGTDAACRSQVQDEWDFAKRQIAKYC